MKTVSKFFSFLKKKIKCEDARDFEERKMVLDSATKIEPKSGEIYFLRCSKVLSMGQAEDINENLRTIFNPAKVILMGPEFTFVTTKQHSDAIAVIREGASCEKELSFVETTKLSHEECSHCAEICIDSYAVATEGSDIKGTICHRCKESFQKGLRPLSAERRAAFRNTIFSGCDTEEEVASIHFQAME